MNQPNSGINNTICKGRYEIQNLLGEGTYGKVYKCLDRWENATVAIKQIKQFDPQQGIPATSVREISILRDCQHPNIVSLKKIDHDGTGKLYLVFEMLEMNLGDLITKYRKDRNQIPTPLIKKILYGIIRGVNYLHENRIFHRDLKPDNILLGAALNKIKLADFGLSRTFHQPMREYSREILTLWYRSPEVCLGNLSYSIGVDTWALGCIMAEMYLGKAIFRGSSDSEQLMMIFQTTGTPTEANWPGVTLFNNFSIKFPKFDKKELSELIPGLCADARDLLGKFLTLDPNQRISCKEALNHSYFKM